MYIYIILALGLLYLISGIINFKKIPPQKRKSFFLLYGMLLFDMLLVIISSFNPNFVFGEEGIILFVLTLMINGMIIFYAYLHSKKR